MDNDRIGQIIDKHRGKPGSLIQALLEIQHENHWLPQDVLDKVSEALEVPMSRIKQIVTFHKSFRLIPRGRHDVHVCTGPSCFVRGSTDLLDSIQDQHGIRPGETEPNLKFSLDTVTCLGSCSLGPEIIIDGTHHGRLASDKVKDVLKKIK